MSSATDHPYGTSPDSHLDRLRHLRSTITATVHDTLDSKIREKLAASQRSGQLVYEPSTPPSRPAPLPFLPLNDRILVRRLDADPSTHAARHQFVMPEAAKEKPLTCEVVAVSLGRLLDSGRLIPSLLAPGDHILVGKYSGTEVKLAGEDLLILREDEVQGVLNGIDEDRIADWLSFVDYTNRKGAPAE